MYNITRPTIFSFFSGAGFLDLGFEKSGYNVAFVNEFHKPFMETYKYSREHMHLPEPEFGYAPNDVSEFIDPSTDSNLKLNTCMTQARERGDFIGFIGGPPCPDFSVGGKNRGSDGENGKLTATYVKVICQQHPDFFLFENVKGLWRTKKHRAFYENMKEKLSANGYVMDERLIDAIEYGVAQQRERIILFGIKKEHLKMIGYDINTPLSEIFPWESHIKYSKSELLAIPFPTVDPFKEGGQLLKPLGVPEELTVQYWFDKNKIDEHDNKDMYFTPRAGRAKFEVIDEGDDSKKSYKRLHRWRYSPTAAYGNNEVHLHPYHARRLSVAEALAIQSLPIDYVLPPKITLSNAFKTVGNGVPYVAAKAIAETILD
ncbi:MAG: cytosine-specific methylase, partial [Neobacillus sp.]|nr:cytosine-specific methylase [Neobacillus sp.]